MSFVFFLVIVLLHATNAVQTVVQITTAADFPPTGQLQPNTTYTLRSELDLRGNSSLSLTGAPEGGSSLDCRTNCFNVAENASISLSSIVIVARYVSAIVRTAGPSAGWSANECKIRLFNTPLFSSSQNPPQFGYLNDLVALTAGSSADVELEGIGAASAPISLRGLVTQSTGPGSALSFVRVRVSRTFVACLFGPCIALGNASLSVSQSAFSYTYNPDQPPSQVLVQVPASNGASDAAVSIVDSSFSLLQLQFSGVRSVQVNGTLLNSSSLSVTVKPAGVLAMANCNVSFNPLTGFGSSLIRIDGPSSVLKITGLTGTSSSPPQYDNFDIVEVASAAVNSSVTISDVHATRLNNVLSYNTRLQMGSQSATLTGLRLVNAGIVNGRCPAMLSVRQVEAINATDRTLIDVDPVFAATVDVRDIVTDRNGGTIVRFSGAFTGNLTVRNVTVTASPTLRAIVQLSGSAANSQVTLSDIAVVGGRVVSSLFAQPNTGSVALSRFTVRGSTTTAILLRTVNGTIDGFDVTNVTLGAAAVSFSGGGTVLRNFKATDCSISSNPIVQFSGLGQFSTPWQMSNILFRNVTSGNGALIEFDTRTGRVDANATASITDVTIQNCTSRVGIRWATSSFFPSAMAGWSVTLERINAVELVGGLIEFNYVYGSPSSTQYTWSDSLRLNSIRADRVSGYLARVALLSDFVATDLRATNCDFVCEPQGNRILVVWNVRTVLLSSVVLADNRGCNTTSTANDASVWLQIISGAVNVTDCAFERLTGGALASLAIVDAPQASLTRTRFDGNRGASALITQASQSSSAMVLSVNDGFFRNNSASTGAAIRATNTHLLVRGSRFYDNAALTDGGAIHLTCCESKLIVGESLFRGNRAGSTGAAVFSSTNSASLAQVDIVENVVADGRANATGAIVHVRGLSASASVDLSRLTVARNVAGANASVVDVSGAKTVVATDVCACGNSANESAEAAAIVCRMSPSTFLSLSNVVAATTAGCMADNSMLQPCTSSGCALRVPMLQADPPTPAPPTLPPVPLPTPQPALGPSPSPPLSDSGSGVTTITSGNGSTTLPLSGSGGAITDGEADIGLIVGAAVGGCVGLLLLIALIVFCVARRRRQGQKGTSAAPHETEMVTARDEGNAGGSVNSGGSIGAPSSSQYGSTFLSTPSSAASASGGNQHYRDMDMRQQQPVEARASTYGDLRISHAYESPAGAAKQQQQHGVYNW